MKLIFCNIQILFEFKLTEQLCYWDHPYPLIPSITPYIPPLHPTSLHIP